MLQNVLKDSIMNELLEELKKQPKEVLQYLILLLMKDNKLSYSDITSVYVEYLEHLKKLTDENYWALQGKVMEMWVGNKKDLRENLKNTIRYLKDKGHINITEEQIEKKG